MTAASVYATTLQRYPIRPNKFSVPRDFFKLEEEERNQVVKDIAEKSGANIHHT